ncbi:DUF7555 family protein [Natronorubrum tibetense]|uniref:DUF3899 domain-containing protein n=1 Tax=Natronorubrum tibetense GA33 TaxID=1114856 RepID=L9W0M2_9EURY|nr:hypothetical protein [Natronorubrum tibetense]ELY43019.1 hypothetical protein C496_06782 [Natronorubrum tibetense GA33]
MTMEGLFGERLRIIARSATDALTYVLVVTASAAVAAVVLAVATGGGLVRAKHLLFLGGWLLLAYATVRLWPTSPDDLESEPNQRTPGESVPKVRDSTRFQRLVRRLPPRRWVRSPRPRYRITVSSKLFLSAVSILVVSFLLETVFGVG